MSAARWALLTLLVIALMAPAASAAPGKHLKLAREKAHEARQATWRCQRRLGERPLKTAWMERETRSAQAIRWVGSLWRERLARCERRLQFRTIPRTDDWVRAVRIVQRVYPGTASWLLSCSSAEGSHGRWVIYGGRPYYPGAEYSYNGHLPQVGGPMQYMWGTFKGHYRRGLETLRARGFIVDLPPPDDVRAWLEMTAQAIAAGWARWSGNDDSHWSASWSNGC